MLKFRSFLAKRLEYQLTVFSLSTFSIPTILLFPDAAIKFGLGKFLTTYAFLSLFLILPLLLIEFFFFDRRVGQSFSRPVTQLKAWRSWPFGRLIGSCQVVISILLLIYYSQLLWPVLVHAIVSPEAPWASCNIQNDLARVTEDLQGSPVITSSIPIINTNRTNTAEIPNLENEKIDKLLSRSIRGSPDQSTNFCYYDKKSLKNSSLRGLPGKRKNRLFSDFSAVLGRKMCQDDQKNFF